MDVVNLLEDGVFAAIAAIGFGSISNVPLKSMAGCALLAAIGHMLRFVLLEWYDWFIVSGSFVGAVCIGMLSIPVSRRFRCPAEAMSFPALLPMIPGMYAYRSVQALLMCFSRHSEDVFSHYIDLFGYNWMVCVITIGLMVIGVTLPIFIFRRHSFSATRQK